MSRPDLPREPRDPSPDDALIARRLDGSLDDDERRVLGQRLEREPALRAAVARQEAIDAALRRAFVAPPEAELAEALRATLQGAERSRPAAQRRRTLWVALRVAAALALAAVGTLLLVRALPPDPDGYDPGPRRSPEALFLALQRDGFRPAWRCRDAEEFAEVFRHRHGARLLLSEFGPFEALGVSWAHVVSPRSTAVLMTADGMPVLVVIDRRDRDTVEPPAEGSPLRRERRELGPLVLYQVGPKSAPPVLSLFRLAPEDAP